MLFCGVYFIINDFVYFIDWNIITLNGRSVIIIFLFDWISLLFMGFVFIISSLLILYSDDYMFGDLNIHQKVNNVKIVFFCEIKSELPQILEKPISVILRVLNFVGVCIFSVI